MSNQVWHLNVSLGFDHRTACGKSLHGWNLHAPKNVTDDPKKVTCQRCIRSTWTPRKSEV